ncbi:MAG: SEC-C metal-binding domain-containing protein [Acidimicrobiia bacterium]|nr:SEC-C metal-binding domain-containing protein [Acidimicrobiia bacterium]
MMVDRRILAKVDRRLLSEMNHEAGTQLVKVPVSDAVWSTWRRYCEAVGVPMGRGLAVLLHQELALVVDEDLEGLASTLADREASIALREAELSERDAELSRRETDVAVRESSVTQSGERLARRSEELDEREANVATAERRIAEQLVGLSPTPASKTRPKRGRNDPCWCGSGKKYKVCHLPLDG